MSARKKEIVICEKNQFSKFVTTAESLDVLQGWMKWFEKRKVEAVLKEVPGFGWAIYRNGLLRRGSDEIRNRK